MITIHTITPAVASAVEFVSSRKPPVTHRQQVLRDLRKAAAAGVLTGAIPEHRKTYPLFSEELDKVAAAEETAGPTLDERLAGNLRSGWGWATAPLLGALFGGSVAGGMSGLANLQDKNKDPRKKRRDLIRAMVLGAGIGGGAGLSGKLVHTGLRNAVNSMSSAEHDATPAAARWAGRSLAFLAPAGAVKGIAARGAKPYTSSLLRDFKLIDKDLTGRQAAARLREIASDYRLSKQPFETWMAGKVPARAQQALSARLAGMGAAERRSVLQTMEGLNRFNPFQRAWWSPTGMGSRMRPVGTFRGLGAGLAGLGLYEYGLPWLARLGEDTAGGMAREAVGIQ